MKNSVRFIFIPAFLCVTGMCLTSGCQEVKKTGAAQAETLEVQSVEDQADGQGQITISDIPQTHKRVIELIKTGEAARAKQDVQTLLQTAQTLREMGAQPVTGTEDLAKNWTVMAESMQTDKSALPPFRGRIKGPAYRKDSLAPTATETIEDIYYAAEQAQLTLEPMSGAKLSWSIFEADTPNDPVCQSQPDAGTQTCRFTPLWTAKYKIRIVNESGQNASYLFITN